MTNTIPNVPRELLERVLNAGWGSETVNALDDLRDFLESASSPAGVDGLSVAAYLAKTTANGRTTTRAALGPVSIVGLRYASEDQSATIESDEPLCRLSDATAIIDGLRGEVASLENRRLDAGAQVGNTRFGVGIKERTVIDAAKRYAEYMAQPEQEADRIAKGAEFLAALQAPAQAIALRTERDQQAQRIGELEGLLREVHDTYRAAIHWEDLRGTMKRIDAALSAGKEGE